MIVTPRTGNNRLVIATVAKSMGKTTTAVHSIGMRAANARAKMTMINANRERKISPVTLIVRYWMIVPISWLVFKAIGIFLIPPRCHKDEKGKGYDIP
jgi:hypothetical protein